MRLALQTASHSGTGCQRSVILLDESLSPSQLDGPAYQEERKNDGGGVCGRSGACAR